MRIFKKNKWVKISDKRKPFDCEIVLINVNLHRDFIISACYCPENLFYVDGNQFETKYITHWRKMPKGPKS